MKHSVVIGGAGFVGSWVVDEILKDFNARVTIIDNLISSESWNISKDPRVNFINGSASRMETLMSVEGKVDYVFQLACFHGNQSSIALPFEDFENGLKTTLVTLEWVKQYHPVAKVIYSGAGCAVAEKTWNDPDPVLEIDTVNLQHDSPYSISKISGEMYCKYYVAQHGLDVVRVRFQNVYGPREILGAGIWRGTENTVWRNVIPTFIYKALIGEGLNVYGSGNATRDFIHVKDVARGIVMALDKGTAGQVYNLASGQETNIKYLAEIIINLTKSPSRINIALARKWDSSGRRVGNTEKSKGALGFEARIELVTGIIETIEWTSSYKTAIEVAIKKHESYMTFGEKYN
jgi:nucleoside-diphosphate-sugar epimerase